VYEGLESLHLRYLPPRKVCICIDNTEAILTLNGNPLNYKTARNSYEEGKILAFCLRFIVCVCDDLKNRMLCGGERDNHLNLVKKRLCEHEVIKPKKRQGQAATRNNNKKKGKQPDPKRKTQNPTPRSLLSFQNIPPYSEVTGTRGRRLRLVGVLVCNRTAAGQPDVELLCLIGLLFGRATMVYPKILLLWVVNMGLEARDPSGWWHSQR
jgi:hypothetical protein